MPGSFDYIWNYSCYSDTGPYGRYLISQVTHYQITFFYMKIKALCTINKHFMYVFCEVQILITIKKETYLFIITKKYTFISFQYRSYIYGVNISNKLLLI